MTTAGQLDLAEQARAHVARVIALLAKPTLLALDESVDELSLATTQIQELRGVASGGESSITSTTLRSSIAGMRNELKRAGLLLRRAWEFRAGLSEQQPGYTEKGELNSPPVAKIHFTLEGYDKGET